MSARRLKMRLHRHQMKAYNSDKKMICLFAGVGAGKTFFGSLWALKKAKQMTPGQLGLIAANSYSQLRDSTLRALYLNCKQWGIPLKPARIPRGYQPFTLEMWNGKYWVEILCRSLDSYEMLSGTELAWAWLDETWQTKKEALELILARLRSNKDRLAEQTELDLDLQMLMTTTLDDPDSSQYEMFVENYDSRLMEVIYATTYDNQKYLPKGYIEDLKTFYTTPMFDRMVLSKWVFLDGSRIYYNFDNYRNITPRAEFDPTLPIMMSFDFNIGAGKPFSLTLSHVKTANRIIQRHPKIIMAPVREFHTFDEIVIESADTNDALDEFESRPYKSITEKPVIIYGDASGHNKDTRSKTTDYGIMRKRGYHVQKVPKKNPPIRARHNAANAMLMDASGKTRAFVNPRCKKLSKGLATVKFKPNAQYLELETDVQHVTTAWSYNLYKEFPLDVLAAEARNKIIGV